MQPPLVAAQPQRGNGGRRDRLGSPPPPTTTPTTTAEASVTPPDTTTTTTNNTIALDVGLPHPETRQQHEQRRQSSVRVLLMFLLMLLVMDDEDPNGPSRLRGSSSRRRPRLEESLYHARVGQDTLLRHIAESHPRYRALMERNEGRDVPQEIRAWCELVKDEFDPHSARPPPLTPMASSSSTTTTTLSSLSLSLEDMESEVVLHYPWNATGLYRGDWTQPKPPDGRNQTTTATTITPTTTTTPTPTTTGFQSTMDYSSLVHRRTESRNGTKATNTSTTTWTALELESSLVQNLQRRGESLAVVPLEHFQPNNNDDDDDEHNAIFFQPKTLALETQQDRATTTAAATAATPQIPLTQDHGRVALQLTSYSIRAVSELSMVTGSIKIYDCGTTGYSTPQDVLVRVRGVLVHHTGQLRLVTAPQVGLVLRDDQDDTTTVRDTVADENDTVPLASDDHNRTKTSQLPSRKPREHVKRRRRRLSDNHDDQWSDLRQAESYGSLTAMASAEVNSMHHHQSNNTTNKNTPQEDMFRHHHHEHEHSSHNNTGNTRSHSNLVFPYPFVRDDAGSTLRKYRTPASRAMPPSEQKYEQNAAGCIFEINLDVEPVEWTVGSWRKLMKRRLMDLKQMNPLTVAEADRQAESTATAKSGKLHKVSARRRRPLQLIQDQALVMNMAGTIHSENCNFTAFVNTTAHRIDWESMTSKAINYSFYMMLVCLTQILILLRQLLHSQSQSAATRVSLLCIGWQTCLDALLCLSHIYLSLAVPRLFTAFASVAFFKLLIFCVIEMKYMAIIIQARNSSDGGVPTDVFRRQVAMLHLRFYVALFAAFFLLFYITDAYRTYAMLILYSFWIPQILTNIVTEARAPLHKYYIYGMSCTRLVAPLYMFGLRSNFLKEVYPESPTDGRMCQLILCWVGIQTALLMAQGKYGARFMIPARFLPPKFDYGRPIPSSLLPPGALDPAPPELIEDRVDVLKGKQREGCDRRATAQDRHQTAETTRHRHKSSRLHHHHHHHGSSMIAEDLARPARLAPSPTLECSICYDAIDIRDSKKYMLAPCNHLFHRDCLVQWMDVKMECPICRTDLPAL